MERHYEFHRVSYYSGVSVQELQELGDQGWEIVEVERDLQDSERVWILLRQPIHAYERGSWEYHTFNCWFKMPEPDWFDHLASCGWIVVAYIHFYPRSFYLTKRPGSYKGTDDGDILARLSDLGYSESLGEERVREILQVKWLQSERQGHNIGTYQAVLYWMAHKIVPALFNQSGLTVPDRAPEALLEDLLSLRATLARGPYFPSLSEVVWQHGQSVI